MFDLNEFQSNRRLTEATEILSVMGTPNQPIQPTAFFPIGFTPLPVQYIWLSTTISIYLSLFICIISFYLNPYHDFTHHPFPLHSYCKALQFKIINQWVLFNSILHSFFPSLTKSTLMYSLNLFTGFNQNLINLLLVFFLKEKI